MGAPIVVNCTPQLPLRLHATPALLVRTWTPSVHLTPLFLLPTPHLRKLTVHIHYTPLNFDLFSFTSTPTVFLFFGRLLLVSVVITGTLRIVVLLLDDGLVLTRICTKILLLIVYLLFTWVGVQFTVWYLTNPLLLLTIDLVVVNVLVTPFLDWLLRVLLTIKCSELIFILRKYTLSTYDSHLWITTVFLFCILLLQLLTILVFILMPFLFCLILYFLNIIIFTIGICHCCLSGGYCSLFLNHLLWVLGTLLAKVKTWSIGQM